jgi:hypothetical protein
MAGSNLEALNGILEKLSAAYRAAIDENVPTVGRHMLEKTKRLQEAEKELKAPVWQEEVGKFLESEGEPTGPERKHAWAVVDFALYFAQAANEDPNSISKDVLAEALQAERRVLDVLGGGRSRQIDVVKLLEATNLYELAHATPAAKLASKKRKR